MWGTFCHLPVFMIIFIIYSAGPDAAATDAGQVPDNVGPDHRKEYPYLKFFLWQKHII